MISHQYAAHWEVDVTHRVEPFSMVCKMIPLSFKNIFLGWDIWKDGTVMMYEHIYASIMQYKGW